MIRRPPRSTRTDTLFPDTTLFRSPDFTLANPNRVRALYGALTGNQAAFRRADGAGYRLIADLVIALDPKNPQTAARMIPPLGRWKRFDEGRQALMRSEEHTSELQSLLRISNAVFCLKQKKQ